MQPNVCSRRGSALGVFAACAPALAVLAVGVLVRAQSAPTPRSVAAATDAVPWIACSASDDPAQDSQEPQTTPGQARIVLRSGTMSLEVRGCTLPQLLSLIASRTGIRIAVSEALPPLRLSIRTPAQSIEAAIRELLRDTDVFVLYAAAPEVGQRLTAVWVYPRGSTGDIEPLPADLWASTRELRHQLTEWNPDLRARAIEELIARAGDAALAASLDVPLQQLHALTLNDPSPEVRLRALQALEERPDSATTVEAATHDRDANVRREAHSILTRVAQSAR